MNSLTQAGVQLVRTAYPKPGASAKKIVQQIGIGQVMLTRWNNYDVKASSESSEKEK